MAIRVYRKIFPYPRRRLLVLILVAFILVGGRPRVGGAGTEAWLDISTGPPGATIPNDFLGLSIETGQNGLLSGHLAPANVSLSALLKSLGPAGVIRVGGATSDSPVPPPLSSELASNLCAFAGEIGPGWSVIYGLDVRVRDSAAAASQATMLSEACRTVTLTFQIGNEPDGVFGPRGRPTFAATWLDYYNAIIAKVPGAKFMGPDAGRTTWLADNAGSANSPFLNEIGAGHLVGLSLHLYPLGPGSDPTSNLHNLMRSVVDATYSEGQPTPSLTALATFNEALSAAKALPLRITEANSVYSGGREGVSDVLASASWALDEMMMLVNHGYSGVNYHGSVSSKQLSYDPVSLNVSTGSYAPRPLFMAMWMFSKLLGNGIAPSVLTGSDDIVSLVTTRSSGSMNILLVNRSLVSPRVVNIAGLPQSWTSAVSLNFDDFGCASKTVSINGATMTEGGQWLPQAPQPVKLTHVDRLSLPPCGAALVAIH